MDGIYFLPLLLSLVGLGLVPTVCELNVLSGSFLQSGTRAETLFQFVLLRLVRSSSDPSPGTIWIHSFIHLVIRSFVGPRSLVKAMKDFEFECTNREGDSFSLLLFLAIAVSLTLTYHLCIYLFRLLF